MRRALLGGTAVVVALAAWFVVRDDPPADPVPAPPPQVTPTGAAPLPLTLLAEDDGVPGRPPGDAGGGDAGEAEDAAVEVTVSDVAGHPIPGAEVTARCGDDLRSARTGPDGVARLRLYAYVWRVAAKAKGFVPASSSERVEHGEVRAVALTLAPGAEIRGVVVTPEGVPVGAAKVDGVWRQGDTVAKRSAVTAGDGTFALDGIDVGARVVLRVTSEDHPMEEAAVAAPDERVRIVLRPGFQVRVRVRGPGGQPAIGCIVSLFPAGTAMTPGRFRGLSWQRGPTWRATGDDGVALFQGMSPGAFVAYARHEPGDGGDGGPFGSARGTVDRPRTEVEIRLEAGHVLAGRVVDDKGQPVATARILIKKDQETIEFEATDADGRFASELFVPPPWQLTAMAQGYETARADAGGTAVTLVMKKLPVLTGRVVDGTGAAVTTFSVNDQAFVASDGRFAVPQQRFVVRKHEIAVTASGFAPTKASIPEGQTDFGNVVLQRGRTLTVTVVDAATLRPVAGAEVRAPGTFSPATIEDLPRGDGPTTDANGVATLTDIGDGAALQVRHPEHVTAEAAVPAGASAMRVALEAGALLRVRVTGERTFGAVELTKFPDGRQLIFVRAKETTVRLLPGRYALRLFSRRPPEQAQEVQLALGRETDVVLGDVPGRPFAVEVSPPPKTAEVLVLAGDVPAPARKAEWTWLSGIAATARAIDGVATFPSLPTGRVTVFVVVYPGFHRVVADVAEGRVAVPVPATLTRVPLE